MRDVSLTRRFAPKIEQAKSSRATCKMTGEKIDAGEYTLEDMMQKIDAIPSNKVIMRQIGVRESVMRVRARPCPVWPWRERAHALPGHALDLALVVLRVPKFTPHH